MVLHDVVLVLKRTIKRSGVDLPQVADAAVDLLLAAGEVAVKEH